MKNMAEEKPAKGGRGVNLSEMRKKDKLSQLEGNDGKKGCCK